MFGKLAGLLPILSRLELNNETLELFTKLLNAAIASGNPNEYLIQKLREAVLDEPSGPKYTTVQVLDERPKKR